MTTKNLELKRATWRKYYYSTYAKRAADHPIKTRRKRYYAEWRKENKALCKEYVRRYKEKNRLTFLVRGAIRRSVASGISCDADYLRTIIKTKPVACECCWKEFDYSIGGERYQPKAKAPTFDRIDQRRGYVAGNVAIICWRCNVLKKDGSLDEIEAIAKYMRRYVDA